MNILADEKELFLHANSHSWIMLNSLIDFVGSSYIQDYQCSFHYSNSVDIISFVPFIQHSNKTNSVGRIPVYAKKKEIIGREYSGAALIKAEYIVLLHYCSTMVIDIFPYFEITTHRFLSATIREWQNCMRWFHYLETLSDNMIRMVRGL